MIMQRLFDETTAPDEKDMKEGSEHYTNLRDFISLIYFILLKI